MTIQAQAADGSVHEFPDGTNPSVIDGVMKQYASSQQPPSFMGAIGKELSGIRQGLYDIPQSAVELGARALDATGLTDNAYKNTHDIFSDANNIGTPGLRTNDPYTVVGRIVGNIAGTLPLADVSLLPKLAGVGDVLNGATQGAAAAGLTSNQSDAGLGKQIGTGAALGAIIPGGFAAAKLAGKVLPDALGVTTGAGGNSIRQAFNAGLSGGTEGQAFTDSMRGNSSWDDVVNSAKQALGNIKGQRNAAYRSGMADVATDPTVLSFDPIDQAVSDASNIKTFKGQDLDPKTADVRTEMSDIINDWKQLPPDQFHTPEGMDALKQKLKGVVDSVPFGTPQKTAAATIYGAVRNSISDQAPQYDKVMSDYSKASDLVDQIQKELSLGPKGNPNTALRKLQSVMRDNANTSWGKRSTYADVLSQNGAPDLLPSLAGQSLSSVAPRGLARLVAGGEGAAALMHPAILPQIAAGLALSSPRLMGETAYGLGTAGRKVGGMFGSVPLPDLSALARLASPAAGALSGFAPSMNLPQYAN